MKKLTFIFLFFISFSSFAFDYHGIKSGMTDLQVNSLVKCVYVDSCDWLETKSFFGGKTPPALVGMLFSYTSDNRLWRIKLRFNEQSGTTGAAAQLKALRELYTDSELDFFGDTIYALLIDTNIFNEDVAKIYRETIHKY